MNYMESNGRMIMNCKCVKRSHHDLIKILFRYERGVPDDNPENYQSGQPAFGPRIEAGTCTHLITKIDVTYLMFFG
jgi:hypothetical protein